MVIPKGLLKKGHPFVMVDHPFMKRLLTSEKQVMNMRAKFIITSIVRHEGIELLHFRAVCKEDGYDAEGRDENNTYAKFSPSADCCLTIANPALLGVYKLGQVFTVDFTPVPQ